MDDGVSSSKKQAIDKKGLKGQEERPLITSVWT